MMLNPSEILAAIGGAAAIVTAIWHAAMYVGKLTVRVDRHQDRLDNHDDRLDRHDEQIGRFSGLPR
jgi:hypothetical protein